MDYVIRPLTAADEPILWEMLYQALQTSEGAPPRDIVRQPQFARHAEGARANRCLKNRSVFWNGPKPNCGTRLVERKHKLFVSQMS
jgi:hypothetical protein